MSVNINIVDIKEYCIERTNVGDYVSQNVSISESAISIYEVLVEDYINQEIRIIDGSANN